MYIFDFVPFTVISITMDELPPPYYPPAQGEYPPPQQPYAYPPQKQPYPPEQVMLLRSREILVQSCWCWEREKLEIENILGPAAICRELHVTRISIWLGRLQSSNTTSVLQPLREKERERESVEIWLKPPHNAAIYSLCPAPLLWAKW